VASYVTYIHILYYVYMRVLASVHALFFMYLFFFLDDIRLSCIHMFLIFFLLMGIGSFMFPLGFITNVYIASAPVHMDRRIPFRLCDHSPNSPVRENYDEHIIMEAVVGFVYMFLI